MTSGRQPGVNAQVIALGSINADFQMRVPRRPDISETLTGTDFVRLGGGKSANVAFVAHRLGAPVRLFGRVGDDDLAEQALAPLRDAGIDLSGVGVAPGCATGVAVITVPPDGKKGIVYAANANHAWRRDDVLPVLDALRDAPPGSVLATNCEVPVAVVKQALLAAQQCRVLTLLDPSPADQVDDELLTLADVIVPNPGEAATLTGIACDHPAAAAAAALQLRQRGVGVALVKLADGGCVLCDGERVLHLCPTPIDVVDTTGAGDAFAGALAVALLTQSDMAIAARDAVAASHLAVTAYGSQPAYPTADEIAGLAHRLKIETMRVDSTDHSGTIAGPVAPERSA